MGNNYNIESEMGPWSKNLPLICNRATFWIRLIRGSSEFLDKLFAFVKLRRLIRSSSMKCIFFWSIFLFWFQQKFNLTSLEFEICEVTEIFLSHFCPLKKNIFCRNFWIVGWLIGWNVLYLDNVFNFKLLASN